MASLEVPEFDLGDLVRIEAAFIGLDGDPVTPDTLAFQYRDPFGAITVVADGDPRIVEDGSGLGTYHINITGNVPGAWDYKWLPGGNAVGVDPGSFYICYPRF